MANGNTVTVVGNVTRDPELRFTANGQATASFGLAVNRRWQKPSDPRVGGGHLVLRCRVLARDGGECQRDAHTRGKSDRDGPARAAQLGDDRSDKRSKIEIVADELGPSLRWATAQVVKNERRGPDGAPGGGASRGAAPHTSAPPAQAAGEAFGSYDEEPF